MNKRLKQIFSPVLSQFETGDGPYNYKPLNRKILLVVGGLFTALSLIVIYVGLSAQGYAFLLPALVFFCMGAVCLIVGALGSDRAVAKIWGNR